MYDSFYKITEQQQKLANLYNQIYTPELLKMQQTYSDIITRMQPSITALQNISETVALAEKSIKSLDTDRFLSAYNHAMEMDRRLMQSMSNVLTSINVDHIASIAQQVKLSTEALENFSRALSLTQSESIISNLCDTIQSMPDSVWDTLSDEEGYSKEEIQAELEVMKTENFPITDINGLTPDQVIEKMWGWLWANHPKAATVLMVAMLTFSTIGVVCTAKDIFFPMAQNAIVKLQGNEDIVFIKVDSAKLYTEPNSHSTVITKILYAEEVTVIESINLWDKVVYIDREGKEVVGWVAKRNLMTYQDYNFNSDELYDME